MAEFYRYQSYDGNLYEGLTPTQLIKLKQDDEKAVQERQSNSTLGPQISAGIRELEEQRQQQPQGEPAATATQTAPLPGVAGDGAMGGMTTTAEPNYPTSNIPSFGSQGFTDEVDKAVQDQQATTTSSMNQTLQGGGVMEPVSQSWEGFTPEQQAGIEQQQAAQQRQMSAPMMNLFKDIPDEVADDLIAQYRMGTLKPNAFIKQITDIKKTLRGAEAEEKKLSFESKLKREEQADVQKGMTDRTKMNLESQELISKLDRESREKIDSLARGNGIYDAPEGISEIDNIAAYSLAYEIGKSRGMKDVYPTIIAGLKTGKSINEIRDEIRFSQQSTGFNQAARSGMQQLFMNKPAKIVDRAYDAFDDLIEKQDEVGMSNYLKKAAQDSYGTTLAQQIVGKDRTIDFLNEIQDDLAAYEEAGGDTNIFSGNLERVAKKAGTVADKNLRTIATKIASAIQQYRRSMSGVAFSVPESKEYSAMFPGIDKTSSFNIATLNALKDVFGGDVAHLYRNAMGDDAYNRFIIGKTPDTTTGTTPDTTTKI